MPERSSVSQGVQLRKESTYGTDPGTATKKLSALGLMLTSEANFPDPFTPMGNKYPSLDPVGREWSSADVSGRGTYTEIIYPLSMIANNSVSTAITVGVTATGTAAREWIFGSLVSGADTTTSYTVEQGDTTFGELATGMILTDFSIDVDRDGVTLGGKAMARALSTGITINVTTTTIALVPVLGQQWDVFMDATSGGLGTTRLTRAFKFTWGLSGRFGGVWPLDSTQTSYAAIIELKPDTTFEVEMEADAVGTTTMFTAMRADASKFFRCRALGSVIEAATKYGLQIDVCGKVVGTPKFGDRDGVKTVTWTLKLFNDTTWSKAFEVRVVNNLTAL